MRGWHRDATTLWRLCQIQMSLNWIPDSLSLAQHPTPMLFPTSSFLKTQQESTGVWGGACGGLERVWEAQPREEAVPYRELPLSTMSASRVRKMARCVCSRVHATHFHTEGPHSVRCQSPRLVSRDSARRKGWWKHRYQSWSLCRRRTSQAQRAVPELEEDLLTGNWSNWKIC